MREWTAFVRERLPSLPCRPEREAEIVEEIASQLSDLYDSARARGASDAEAMARVEAEVPDWDALASDLLAAEHPVSAPVRRTRLYDLTGDVRHALRALRATPVFTAVTVLTLALGIGATSAIFSLVNAVLLKPLAFRDPSRLVIGQTTIPELGDRYPVVPVNAKEFTAWREGCRTTCEQLGAIELVYATLTGDDRPESLAGGRVTANMFDVLGVPPHIGRTFTADDETPGRDNVVVLAHALWRRRFGSDATVIGRRIMLDGQPHEVVGVLPPDAALPDVAHLYTIQGRGGEPAYFTPLTITADERGNDGDFDYIVIMRLRGDATPEQAALELTPITAEAFRGSPIHPRPVVRPLGDQLVSRVRRSMWLLFAAVAAAFIVGCVNLANLLTSRWVGRRRELAIRTAMGAGRGELARYVIVETMCLAVAGGLLGLPVAHALVRTLLTLAPTDIPRLQEVSIDGGVLAFAALLMIGCSFACSLVPVWSVWRTDPADVLKEGAHTTTDSPMWTRVRSVLVGGEVGLATALLMVAALLLASFVAVLDVDPGFRPERRVAVDFRLSLTRYPEVRDRVRLVDRLLEEIRAAASVESAAAIQKLPLEGEATVDSFITREGTRTTLESLGNHYFVTPDYFATMGIEVTAGRVFGNEDRSRAVALVSEHTARTLWPGETAIGKVFWRTNRRVRWEVIGVVADTRSSGLDDSTGLTAYVPYWERTAPDFSFVIRSRAETDVILRDLQTIVRRVDPELPLVDLRTLDTVVERAVAARRFQLLVTLAFAGAGLAIACLGIYGVVAAAVHRRRGELAIRMALGGSPRNVALLVAAQGMRPVVCGLVLGTLAAAALGSWVRSMLFGVSPNDPAVLGAVGALVLAIGAIACLGPALRASRTPPLTALRQP